MKIAVISTYPSKGAHHDYQGGVAAYTKNLVTSVSKLPSRELIVMANQDGKDSTYNEAENIEVIRAWKKGISFYKDLLKVLSENKIDLVHIQQELRLYGEIYSSFSLLYFIWKLRRKKIKNVVTIHGVVAKRFITRKFLEENNSKFPAFVIRLGFKTIFSTICKFADQVVVHEKFFKEVLIKDYGAKPQKVNVISLGVEDIKPKVTNAQAKKELKIKKKRVVLFFGYVTSYKSPELLIDAFKEYSKSDPDSLLIIAGGKHPGLSNDPKYSKRYRELQTSAKEIKKDQIWWYGFVEEKDIQKIIMASDLLIFPYTVPLSTSAPLSLALTYRKPFLVSEEISTFFSDKKFSFRSNSKSLAKSLKEFFNDKISIKDYVESERARRLWGNIAKEFDRIYLKINKRKNY
ncbi:MAG: glycosyltransferase [Patescibacteria group bacterium]|nr:glycosyltransferase [Patescibacteria group bacterium]